MSENKNLAFDIMGADKGPEVAFSAAVKFAKENSDINLFVYGDNKYNKGSLPSNLTFVETSEVITMEDKILTALRKKDSSLIKAIYDVKAKKVDGIVSAGQTGVYLAAASMIIKNVEGVERSALMPIIPTANTKSPISVILDAGASTEQNTKFMIQYAKMGSIFMKNVYGVDKPKVGLLNIGTEDKKGTEFYQETNALLKETNLNYVGNVEGRGFFEGEVEVIVADGFTGNIVLKTAEGVAITMFNQVRKGLKRTIKSKIGAILSKRALKKQLQPFDYRYTGGALLIGIDGVVVKAHGSSDDTAFYHALKVGKKMVQAEVVNTIKEEFKNEGSTKKTKPKG